MTSPDDDPLRQLERWGRRVDRRARRAQWRRRVLYALGAPGRLVRRRIGLIVGLLVVAVVAGLVYEKYAPPRHAQAGLAQPGPVASGPADSGPGATVSPTANSTAGEPFAGTPAAAWPAGEAGVRMPAPADVSGFSASTVAIDLDTVRQALIAARLEPRMLVDHDPTRLAALVAPDDWPVLRKAFDEHKLLLVTLIDDQARLATDLPRVNGQAAYRSTLDSTGRRVLEVDTNFVWVYAFADGQIAVLHDSAVLRFYRSADVARSSAGMWVVWTQWYGVNVDCDQLAQGVLAPSTPADPSALDDYWDPGHSVDDPPSC